jgi:selenocysteine lyase/cysteine desulfurase
MRGNDTDRHPYALADRPRTGLGVKSMREGYGISEEATVAYEQAHETVARFMKATMPSVSLVLTDSSVN